MLIFFFKYLETLVIWIVTCGKSLILCLGKFSLLLSCPLPHTMLGTEPNTLWQINKHCTTELHPWPLDPWHLEGSYVSQVSTSMFSVMTDVGTSCLQQFLSKQCVEFRIIVFYYFHVSRLLPGTLKFFYKFITWRSPWSFYSPCKKDTIILKGIVMSE